MCGVLHLYGNDLSVKGVGICTGTPFCMWKYCRGKGSAYVPRTLSYAKRCRGWGVAGVRGPLSNGENVGEKGSRMCGGPHLYGHSLSAKGVGICTGTSSCMWKYCRGKGAAGVPRTFFVCEKSAGEGGLQMYEGPFSMKKNVFN